MDTFNANKRWVQCAYPDCPNYVDTEATGPANYLRILSPLVPVEGKKEWYACEQHLNQVKTDIQYIVELKFEDAPKKVIDEQAQQILRLIGYTYRKPLEPKAKDIDNGIAKWARHLTEWDESGNGANLEVALLNALARLGIPTLFAGSASCGGNETPVYDLLALGLFKINTPRVVLISCKNSKTQPNIGDIGKLSDDVHKVQQLLPGWLVSGTLAITTEPTAQDFNYRSDIRIWKRSHLQAILNACAREQIQNLLWTTPSNWNAASERLWRSFYDSYTRK